LNKIIKIEIFSIKKMGIYNNYSIYGIRIYNFNDDEFTNILYEKIYNEIISDDEKKKEYLFYTELNNKNEIYFFNIILNVVAHVLKIVF